MIDRIRKAVDPFARSLDGIWELQNELTLFLEHEQWESGIQDARYSDPKCLVRFGYRACSQSDEDGIIAEILRRIGPGSNVFFEFGVEDGRTNNTLNLLMAGWKGYWIEGSAEDVERIEKRLESYIASGHLKALNAFITRENIEELIGRLGVPSDVDLVSIDIDGNDYWVWERIESLSPRIVAIEYNATLRPTHSVVMPYNPKNVWDRTNYFGASLAALVKLGARKGYSLVGCNYTGVNAFFVRNDLLGDRFLAPYTAEVHYQPARYLRLKCGHPPGAGPYVEV
jgi:hypothetical protein